MMREMTQRTKDYLVSFGECMSTRVFAAYMNKIGVKARQYDAFEIGFITNDDFTNADILEATYPAVAKRLSRDWISDPAIPIVTGFLGKGWKSCVVTTLGRGGSDLTATTIGKALGLREIQVWKDVDGVLTCDPFFYPSAEPVPYLTFDEAAELAYFGAQELDHMVEELEKIAVVNLRQNRSIISLIGNVQRSSLILEKIQQRVLTKMLLVPAYPGKNANWRETHRKKYFCILGERRDDYLSSRPNVPVELGTLVASSHNNPRFYNEQSFCIPVCVVCLC